MTIDYNIWSFQKFIEFKNKQMNLLAGLINYFINLQLIKKGKLRFPRAYQFIVYRLSLNKFIGLPLTLLLAIFVANLFLFDEISENIVNSSRMLLIDDSFAKFLFGIRNNTIANGFYYFSMLGSINVVLPLSLVIILILLWKKQLAALVALLISLAGIILTILLGKQYFHRIRPVGYSFYNEVSYSFPSGHAVVSIAFYGLLFYMIIRYRNQYKLRWTVIAFLFIFLLGFSRLYLCVHFLSDVLAGYSLGLLWLMLSISIIEWKSSIAKNWYKL